MTQARMTMICRQYLAELKNLRSSGVPIVSAGRLAEHLHVSRATCKKYLGELVRAGKVVEYDFIHTNGQTATAYMPARAGLGE